MVKSTPSAVAIVALATLSATAANATLTAAGAKPSNIEISSFDAFAQAYGKSYSTAADRSAHAEAFADSAKKAAALQSRNPHATFGINKFADVSEEAFLKKRLAGKGKKKSSAASAAVISPPPPPAATTAAIAVDWRTERAVTSVRDQGDCSSGWAFAAVGNIESQWKLHNPQNEITELSAQDFVSCVKPSVYGCDGGDDRQDDSSPMGNQKAITDGFEWLVAERNGWIPTAQSYPYTSKSSFVSACKPENDRNLVYGGHIVAHKKIRADEEELTQFVLHRGPFAAAIDGSSLKSYLGGVITDCVSETLNHAVLVVGYNATTSPAYWIVKNSWGTDWGMKGYMYIAKGSNQCLINEAASSALME